MKTPLLFLFLAWHVVARAQTPAQPGLQPGFDQEEYIELLRAYSRWGDSVFYHGIDASTRYQPVYRSPVNGLENAWELYRDATRNVAVVSIRGTTADPVSWLANFYAAMVPARGQLQLSDEQTFDYTLAEHPQAAVHVGWLVALASMAPDIRAKLDSCYQAGTRDIMLMGHSQGGAITFLLTAYLHHLQKAGELPADLRFKSYCSASPKPGNLYFAYEYEAATAGGWSSTVVNSADWVPEVPISIQTLHDFNPTNPFTNAQASIKQQKFPNRVALNYVYKQLTKHTLRAQKRYQKYLGKMASKMVVKQLPGFQVPKYYDSNHYVRTGPYVVLLANGPYLNEFPDSDTTVFIHHMLQSYLWLAQRMEVTSGGPSSDLQGSWQLDYLSGIRIAFEGLYPDARPVLMLDPENQLVNGNSSCNAFTAQAEFAGTSLTIHKPMAATMRACPGEGEMRFFQMLEQVNRYALTGRNTLELYANDVPVMRFTKLR
ncbi:META domain-containing protein [Catalinimonas alkaloidigena]|uniref:META domain-containing protein n=1 Tax=Catalinimonas alkaloidigena TaxID=1075417 RepID=A0A1G9K1G0_9BACT|nr:META domain-containing protein [Catalinimonas alkaloidigena]SDL43667.1 META domain-containing protein [Catalinimonas alkaloidigena]